VLVVVPTLNESAHIEQVLHSLWCDLPAHLPTRFVVCDGGSVDGTPAIVQRLAAEPGHPELHLLHNPARLQSAAVNLAVARHGQDCAVLVRCDAHAAYPRGYVTRLLRSLVDSGADAVVVPMDSVAEPGPGRCLQKAVAWVSDTVVGSGGSAHRGGRRSGFVDHGHHAAFRLASFRRTGGYDESFSHNEDAELDCRQRALGARIWLDADIRLAYHPRDTLRALARQYFGYGRGRSRTVRRHPQSWRARQAAVPLNLFLCVLGLLVGAAATATGAPWWLALPALWPLLYAGVLFSTSWALAWRHRSLCGLLAGPAAAVMHLAWAAGFFTGCLTKRKEPLLAGQAAGEAG